MCTFDAEALDDAKSTLETVETYSSLLIDGEVLDIALLSYEDNLLPLELNAIIL